MADDTQVQVQYIASNTKQQSNKTKRKKRANNKQANKPKDMESSLTHTHDLPEKKAILYPNMESIKVRQSTFHCWLNAYVSSMMLAAAGFFFTGKEDETDEVTCYACGLKVMDWKMSHLPLLRHAQMSPMCEFLRNQMPGASTMGRPSDSNSENSMESQVPAPSTNPEISAQGENQGSSTVYNAGNIAGLSYPLHSQLLPSQSHSKLPVPVQLEQLPLNGMNNFRSKEELFTHYQDRNMRLTSFYNDLRPWPCDAPMTPEDLVDAGLFYTGENDKVQCAFCRGKLFNWALGDDALHEHKRHFPDCLYVMEKLRERESGFVQSDCVVAMESRDETVASRRPVKQNDGHAMAPTSSESAECSAIKSLKSMGYSMSIIKRALQKLGISISSRAELQQLSAEVLIDTVLELEDGCEVVEEDEPTAFTTQEQPTATLMASQSIVNTASTSLVTNTKKNGYTDERLQKLEEEKERLKSITTCRVCLDQDVTILFLPCRHLVCCERCGYKVEKCPLCRAVVVGSVKTFLA